MSFANSDWHADSRPLKRIGHEAESMRVFDNIFLYTENDFDKDYVAKYGNRFKERSFGYWQWKPYVIRKVYNQMKSGDILFWCDSGCHLNKRGKRRLKEYINMLQHSDKSILVFIQSLQERNWTKGDFFRYFNMDYSRFTDNQFWSGGFFLKKTTQCDAFLDDWYDICHNHHELTTDAPSEFKNFSSFKENRHDQSALSMLIHARYKDSVLILSADETWADEDWSLLWRFPIWACRDHVKEVKLNAFENHFNPVRAFRREMKKMKKAVKKIICK